MNGANGFLVIFQHVAKYIIVSKCNVYSHWAGAVKCLSSVFSWRLIKVSLKYCNTSTWQPFVSLLVFCRFFVDFYLKQVSEMNQNHSDVLLTPIVRSTGARHLLRYSVLCFGKDQSLEQFNGQKKGYILMGKFQVMYSS